MFAKSFLAVLVIAFAAGVIGCASNEPDPTRQDRQRYSTVPWNKPESWEGQGVLGGMMQ